MEDSRIIELYFSRSEDAVKETDIKYGGFCRAVAQNILSIREDAEECVNDAYLKAWRAIPPERPVSLKAWLGRVVRNLSIDRWRKNRTQKRYAGMETLLSELEECIPCGESTDRAVEEQELARVISDWLDSLAKEDRVLFVRRYWYGYALKSLAAENGASPGRLAGRMHRLRLSLKAALEKEGVSI